MTATPESYQKIPRILDAFAAADLRLMVDHIAEMRRANPHASGTPIVAQIEIEPGVIEFWTLDAIDRVARAELAVIEDDGTPATATVPEVRNLRRLPFINVLGGIDPNGGAA